MEDCLCLPGLEWMIFSPLKTHQDEVLHIYDDENLVWFVRQSIKGGKVCAFNKYNESKICDDIFEYIWEKLIFK